MNSHPDTETLSAFLDGEAPEVEGHVATCADCQRQVDVLAQVKTAVGAPVPPPDERHRDAAVAAALGVTGQKTSVAPGRRWTIVAAAGAVAAAALVGLVVTRIGTSHKSSTVAQEKAGPVSGQLIRAGDLGDVDDAQALRAKVEPGLPAKAGPQTAASPAAGDQSAGAAPSTATTQRRALSAARTTGEPSRCEGVARTLQPGRVVLVYLATARWQGTPADVFGFSPAGAPATSSPGRPTPTRVYVLARSDCRLLVFQSFAP
jgi:hypothetical protein